MKGSTTLYRGLKMTQKEFDSYKTCTTTHLMGYTSTSMDLSVATNFALNNSNDDKIPVIFEINFIGSHGLFKLIEGYTAFANESEVLVQDGLEYKVCEIT